MTFGELPDDENLDKGEFIDSRESMIEDDWKKINEIINWPKMDYERLTSYGEPIDDAHGVFKQLSPEQQAEMDAIFLGIQARQMQLDKDFQRYFAEENPQESGEEPKTPTLEDWARYNLKKTIELFTTFSKSPALDFDLPVHNKINDKDLVIQNYFPLPNLILKADKFVSPEVLSILNGFNTLQMQADFMEYFRTNIRNEDQQEPTINDYKRYHRLQNEGKNPDNKPTEE
jgi:hypothetical protein